MDPDPKLFYPFFLPIFFQKFSPGENYQILEIFCYYKYFIPNMDPDSKLFYPHFLPNFF